MQLARRHVVIPDGKSKGLQPWDFDPAQLARGTKVEMEHTTDPRIAQRIAMDHLTEDRNYYKKLAKVHLDGYRRRRSLGAYEKTCSNSPRWIRGSAGFVLGALLGGMAGGGIASVMMYEGFSLTDPVGSFQLSRKMIFLATGLTFAGATIGLVVGAHKPEC